MHNLFLKIFLWFWLTVVLVGATLVVTTVLTRSQAQQEWRTPLALNLPREARESASVYEQQGAEGLRNHFLALESKQQPNFGLRFYLFDSEAHDLLSDNGLPEQAKYMVYAAQEDALVGHSGLEQYALQKVRTVKGVYTFLAIFAPAPLPLPVLLKQLGAVALVRMGVVLLVAVAFCFWLTRYITGPVVQLGHVAEMIANGHLGARASKEIRARRDEIGRLGLTFDRMAARIESLIGAQQRLLGVVSHELRSPLGRLCVALGLLRQCPEQERAEYLDRIELEAEHLDTLIGQLLTLARVDAGVNPEVREAFDLETLVREIAADGDFEAQSFDCSVIVNSAARCALVGDPENVRRAIENVVRNAIRYTDAGTSVEIDLTRDDVSVPAEALLRVRDHGLGVPEAHLEDIFRPFHRVPEARNTTSDGAGLGLAITDRIVRRMGGRVTARNAVQRGLIVEIRLPLQGRQQQANIMTPAEPHPAST
jgi:signal transduction histidine kinase